MLEVSLQGGDSNSQLDASCWSEIGCVHWSDDRHLYILKATSTTAVNRFSDDLSGT